MDRAILIYKRDELTNTTNNNNVPVSQINANIWSKWANQEVLAVCKISGNLSFESISCDLVGSMRLSGSGLSRNLAAITIPEKYVNRYIKGMFTIVFFQNIDRKKMGTAASQPSAIAP